MSCTNSYNNSAKIASQIIMNNFPKKEDTRQNIQAKKGPQELINCDVNMINLLNRLEWDARFKDLTEFHQEDSKNIKKHLLDLITNMMEQPNFRNDIYGFFKGQFSSDDYKAYSAKIDDEFDKNFDTFKEKMLNLVDNRLTALCKSEWNKDINMEDKQCYSLLESTFVQQGYGNTIGYDHLVLLSKYKDWFGLFIQCSMLATILPVVKEVSSMIQQKNNEQLQLILNAKNDMVLKFKSDYKNTDLYNNADVFIVGFETNFWDCGKHLDNKDWLINRIREQVQTRFNCYIEKFDNWKTIKQQATDMLEKEVFGSNISNQCALVNIEYELLKAIREGLFNYLNKQIGQNQHPRAGKENGTIIEEKNEEESKSEENNVNANNEKHDNKEDEKKNIDSKQDEKNGEMEEDKLSNSSLNNYMRIDECIQNNRKSNNSCVDENDLEVIELDGDKNKSNKNNDDKNNLHVENNKQDEKKDIDNNEKNREIKEEKRSNSSLKKDMKINEGIKENSNRNENNNDLKLEAFTLNQGNENNNIDENVDAVANNKTEQNNENNNNVVNQHQNENNNDHEQNIDRQRGEIQELDTDNELDNDTLQQIYNRSFDIDTFIGNRGLQRQARICFTADAMQNIRPRWGIACLFSKKANLENTLYEKLQQNRQPNNDRPTILLQELENIINTAGGCC